MNIAIFELEHFEAINALIQLFDPIKNNITVFTSSQGYQQLKYSFQNRIKQCKWILIRPTEPKYRFIYRTYQETKRSGIDLLILNTINNNFVLYALLVKSLKRVRIVLGVHDINSYFQYKPSLSARRCIRNIGKRWLMSSIGEFNTPSIAMASHLKKRIPAYKKVHCLPGSIFVESYVIKQVPSLHGGIILVVPGTIDGRRRDYEIVFDLLNGANEISFPISVVLLGCAYKEYGHAIIEKCRLYAKTSHNLKFYECDLVDQPEFDRVVAMAHFIFIPSVIQTVIFDGIEEIYGVSKHSGTLFDVVRHVKPFIIPNGLDVDEYLQNSCIRFEKVQDILDALLKLHSWPENYLQLQDKALMSSRNYTIEKVRERNTDIFSGV